MELQPYIFFYGRPNKTWGQSLSIKLNDYPPSTDSQYNRVGAPFGGGIRCAGF